MTITEVLPKLKELDRKDKIRAIQFLVNEVAKEEEIVFEESKTYEIWSPFDSFEAAEQLQKMIDEEEVVNA